MAGGSSGSTARFVRYVDSLNDAEKLELHRIACKRAAVIYGRIYKENWRRGVAASRSLQSRSS